MSTATESPQQAQITFPTRVQSIPLVNDALSTINALLLQNALTAWTYTRAQAISQTAYTVSEPIQVRLAPVLVPIDNLANRSLDFVEAKYPYPFQTNSEGLVEDLKKQRDQVVDVAAKTYDVRIKSPAVHLAQGADQQLTPVVDILQAAYDKLNGGADGSQPQPNGDGSESQVHRALRLGFGLKDQVIVLSAEQLRQLQAHSIVVQRTTDALINLNAILASSIVVAKDRGTAITKDGYARVNSLVEAVRVELDRLSQTLPSLPAQFQQTLQPIYGRINETGEALTSVIRSEAPASEKASQAVKTLREQIPPLVEETVKAVKEGFSGAIEFVHSKGASANGTAPEGSPNGNGKA